MSETNETKFKVGQQVRIIHSPHPEIPDRTIGTVRAVDPFPHLPFPYSVSANGILFGRLFAETELEEV